jgi:hypothetical protein
MDFFAVVLDFIEPQFYLLKVLALFAEIRLFWPKLWFLGSF